MMPHWNPTLKSSMLDEKANVAKRGMGNKNWVYLEAKHSLKLSNILLFRPEFLLNKLNFHFQKTLKVTFAEEKARAICVPILCYRVASSTRMCYFPCKSPPKCTTSVACMSCCHAHARQWIPCGVWVQISWFFSLLSFKLYIIRHATPVVLNQLLKPFTIGKEIPKHVLSPPHYDDEQFEKTAFFRRNLLDMNRFK